MMRYAAEGWDFLPWFHGFGWLFMVLLVALVVWGVLALSRSAATRGAGANRGDRALEVLRERYAKGEIGAEEFEAMKHTLN